MTTIKTGKRNSIEIDGTSVAKREVFINRRLRSDVKCVIIRAGKTDLTYVRVSECTGFGPEYTWAQINPRWGAQKWTVTYDEFRDSIFGGWSVADIQIEAAHEQAVIDNLMFDLDRKVNPNASQLLRTLLEDAEQRGYNEAPTCNCNCGRR